MKAFIRSFLVLSLALSLFQTAFATEGSKNEKIHADVKVQYQVGILAYVDVLDDRFELTVGEAFKIDNKFANSNRKTRLSITVLSTNEQDGTLTILVTRQDFRGERALGTPNRAQFVHKLNRGKSVISLRGQDPATKGPFRIHLNF